MDWAATVDATERFPAGQGPAGGEGEEVPSQVQTMGTGMSLALEIRTLTKQLLWSLSQHGCISTGGPNPSTTLAAGGRKLT